MDVSAGGLLDQHEVIVHASAYNESALVRGHKLSQPWGEPEGEDLCDELGHKVEQANGAVLREGGGFLPFGQEGD